MTMTSPVMFVTNYVPPDRVGAFTALHERVGIELLLFGGRSHHGTAGVARPGVLLEVGERLLHDAERGDAHGRRQERLVTAQIESAGDARPRRLHRGLSRRNRRLQTQIPCRLVGSNRRAAKIPGCHSRYFSRAVAASSVQAASAAFCEMLDAQVTT